MSNLPDINQNIDDPMYYGKWVALDDANNKKVVGFGEDPTLLLEKVKKDGYEHGIIIYCPPPDTTFLL